MSKSNKYNGLSEWSLPLRDWQERAFETYMVSKKSSILISATPGAGKTFFGLRVAHDELISGRAQQILIVVPSENLRGQWRDEAHEFGINLTTDYDAQFPIAGDYHGVVTTYATIASRTSNASNTFRKYTSQRPTFGVLDEIHHVGESKAWGDGLQAALSPCTRRLIITGTPFRSDNNQIPFVEYARRNGGMESVPDFQYGYGDGVRDGVVRDVYFQTFDGDVRWFEPDGTIVDVDFTTNLNPRLTAQRMRFALDPGGDWLRKVLSDAHERLTEIRRTDPSAGGLVVTRDKDHARLVANLVMDVTGNRPMLVTSDELDANDKIDSFRRSDSEWIVAVKMVSEGVDIRRLRVGVWATNTQTELFFRQVVGRIVRMSAEPEDQGAWQYIPRLEPLTIYAEAMKRERVHVIDDLDVLDEETLAAGRGELLDKPAPVFIDNDGEVSDLLHDGSRYSAEEIATATEWCKLRGLAFPTGPYLRTVLEIFRSVAPIHSTAAQTNGTHRPNGKALEEEKAELRRRGGKIARALNALIEASGGILKHDHINRAINEAQGVYKIDSCTKDQLIERVQIMLAWRKAFEDGTGRQFTVKGYLRQHTGERAGSWAIPQ